MITTVLSFDTAMKTNMKTKILSVLVTLMMLFACSCSAPSEDSSGSNPLTVVGTTTAGTSTVAPVTQTTLPAKTTASTPAATTTASTAASSATPFTSVASVTSSVQTTTSETSETSTVSESAATSDTSTTSCAPASSQTEETSTSISSTAPNSTLPGNMDELFSSLTLEEKVGQLFIVSIPGKTLSSGDRAFLSDCHIGNIILFAANIDSLEQTASLNASIRQTISDNTGVVPFISVDQEGGKVMRVMDACLAPPMMAVGSIGDTGIARELGALMGEQLYTLGFNLDFAPDADVNSNPNNPIIGDRSFGEDPQAVASMVSAFAEGLQSSGVLGCIKHFPGHGDTSEDSHTSLPCVKTSREELEKTELVPFRSGIEAGVAMTMVGHILYPALGADKVPASLSSDVIQGVLRDELGFNGLIVTDSLSMGAVTNTWGQTKSCVMAFKAGVDMLLINDTEAVMRGCYQAVLDAVRSGEISEKRLDDSVRRILETKYAFGLFSAEAPSGKVPDTQKYDALLKEISRDSLALIDGTSTAIDLSSSAVLFTEPRKSSLVTKTGSLGAYLSGQYSGCTSTQIVKSPDADQIAAACNAHSQASAYILAISGKGNAGLAKKLIATGKPVIICVMDSPYTAAAYTGLGAAAVYCAYDNTDYTIAAVADVIVSAS